jgi:hypothetical protein
MENLGNYSPQDFPLEETVIYEPRAPQDLIVEVQHSEGNNYQTWLTGPSASSSHGSNPRLPVKRTMTQMDDNVNPGKRKNKRPTKFKEVRFLKISIEIHEDEPLGKLFPKKKPEMSPPRLI